MGMKYWEFEDAPLKEKLKQLNVKDVARIFFDNGQRPTDSQLLSIR